MSELKAIDDLYERRIRNGSDPYKIKLVDVRHPPVYLKSEADKVIAELEESHKREVEQLLMEIVKLEAQVHDYAQSLYVMQARAEKEARHHKYKRCLAMWLYLRECYWRCQHHNEQTRADWYNKCMDKFQKLAEHYKEGS